MAERERGMVDETNNSFVFYSSFLNAIKCLPRENQLYAYQYITEYALQWIVPDQNEDSIAYAIFLMAKPQIDANLDRRKNGNKWWRPPKEKPMVSENTENEKPMVSENEQNEKPNVNVNVNVNENVEGVVGGEKEQFFEYVFLTKKEHSKLIDTYGEKVTNGYIEKLNNRIWENPNEKKRKKKSHYHTLCKRMNDAWIPKLPPKPPENESWIYDLPF